MRKSIILIALITLVLTVPVFARPTPMTFDFNLSSNPSSGTVFPGQLASSTITVTLIKGSSQTVTLSVTGCPSYTTCKLNKTSGNPTFYSSLGINTTSKTPYGTYIIKVNGVGGGNTRSTSYSLTVAHLDSCSDTDGGINPTVFGTVSGYLNNSPFSNSDVCANSDIVVENYCAGNHKAMQNISCGTDSYGSNYCLNSSVFRDFTNFSCASGACYNITTPQQVEFCPYGCTNGACSICTPNCIGKQCGDNGCGGSCGTCNLPQTCNSTGQCVCNPTTCQALGKNCGSWSDDCGAALNCGNCTFGSCNSTGQCVCIPTTCLALGKSCGSWSDGCGGTLNCGTCSLGNCNSTGQCQISASNCSDGTVNGQCSVTKPNYCYNGTLINNCQVCGCSSGQTCNSTTNTCYTPSSNLIAYWKFDEGSGATASDSSGKGSTGTLINSPIWVTGKYGNALQFDGTNKYVDTSFVQNSVTQYSIGAWIKTTSTGANPIVQDRGSGAGESITMEIGYNGGQGANAGTVNCGLDSNYLWIGGYTSRTVNDGNWHHVVCIFNSSSGSSITPSNFAVYIDGSPASLITSAYGSATSPVSGLSGTKIGYHQAWGNYFNGVIDEVKVWNKTLTASEINSEYSTQTNCSSVCQAQGFTTGTCEAGNSNSTGSFSIIHITDTQHLASDHPDLDYQLTNWIADYAKTHDVEMVVHTGDLVDFGNTETMVNVYEPDYGFWVNSQYEWNVASNSLMTLYNAGVPYVWCAGNHDQIGDNDATKAALSWDGKNYSAFNVTNMESKSYWVSDNNEGKNTAAQFTVGNYKFLVIDVEFYADSDTLTWMENLLDTYSKQNYNIIVGTHAYLDQPYGNLDTTVPGDEEWAQNFQNILDRYPNVFLVLSGHSHDSSTNYASVRNVASDGRMQSQFDFQEKDGAYDYPLDGITSNPQVWEGQGADTAKIYTFDLASKTVSISTYSIYDSTWLTDPAENFSFSANLVQTTENFSIMQITDTQFLSSTYPDLYNQLTTWIANNSAAYNLKMVVHTGDITDQYYDSTQWQNANASMNILTSNGVPYIWCAGNHDQNGFSDPDSGWVGNQYYAFNPTSFEGKSYWVSDYNQGKNTAAQFSVGNYKFLIIDLESSPNTNDINWATGLLNTYSAQNYNIIVATHAFLNDGCTFDNGLSNNPAYQDPVWEENLQNLLNNYPRVFMTLNGHAGDTRLSCHNTVNNRTQIQWDWQTPDNQTGADAVRIYTINPTNDTVSVTTYSVLNNLWYDNSLGNRFNFSANLIPSTVTGSCQAGETQNTQGNFECTALCCCSSPSQCTPGTDIIKQSSYPFGICTSSPSYLWSHSTCGSSGVCNQTFCSLVNSTMDSYTLPSGKYARGNAITIPYVIKNNGNAAWCFLTEAGITLPNGTTIYPDKLDFVSTLASNNSIKYQTTCSDPLGNWAGSFYTYTDTYTNGGWKTWGTPSFNFSLVECLNNQDCANCKGSGYVCNSTNACVQSGAIYPSYSKSSVNNTVAGKPTMFSLNWTAGTYPLSGYIFSTNNSGRWQNDSWTSFSGTWSNVTKMLNSTSGINVWWCIYANDTSNNRNGTSCQNPFSLTTTAGAAPIALIQGYSQGVAFSGSSIHVSLSSTPVQGNVLIATVDIGTQYNTGSTVSNISETGVAWSPAVKEYSVDISGWGYAAEIWYGVVGSGASKDVYVNLTNSITSGDTAVADIDEFSGLATTNVVDRTATQTIDETGQTYTFTGSTSTTTQGKELWVGNIVNHNGYNQDSPRNGFTLQDGIVHWGGVTGCGNGFLYYIASSTGSAWSGDYVAGGDYWGAIATFKGS